jgi:hypothetical protein
MPVSRERKKKRPELITTRAFLSLFLQATDFYTGNIARCNYAISSNT